MLSEIWAPPAEPEFQVQYDANNTVIFVYSYDAVPILAEPVPGYRKPGKAGKDVNPWEDDPFWSVDRLGSEYSAVNDVCRILMTCIHLCHAQGPEQYPLESINGHTIGQQAWFCCPCIWCVDYQAVFPSKNKKPTFDTISSFLGHLYSKASEDKGVAWEKKWVDMGKVARRVHPSPHQISIICEVWTQADWPNWMWTREKFESHVCCRTPAIQGGGTFPFKSVVSGKELDMVTAFLLVPEGVWDQPARLSPAVTTPEAMAWPAGQGPLLATPTCTPRPLPQLQLPLQ